VIFYNQYKAGLIKREGTDMYECLQYHYSTPPDSFVKEMEDRMLKPEIKTTNI
jgi:hypothetical protein